VGVWELRVRWPLIELRLLRHRPVLAANLTAFLVAVGFYPLGSLVVRFVQTPDSAGYGFGASVLVAGLMLTPFSLASFAASKVASRASRRASPELIVVAGCIAPIASMVFPARPGRILADRDRHDRGWLRRRMRLRG
jgi:hypothetical protein